ncbi:MAG: type II toxin-antitoxin system VapC family toxin [Kouleothrix sp.]|nr:type II toxin-antitoxin system VapC family toxin [Kouleothrix sp.]
MLYLLDTNVCVAYLRRADSPVRQRLARHAAVDIVVCSVVYAELRYGALRNADPARASAQLAAFLVRFVSLPLDDRAAEISATLRADLSAKGTPIGPHDLLIAAITLANDLTLVTHNTREFGRVASLRLEDWEIAQ